MTEDGTPIIYSSGSDAPIMEEWTFVDRQYVTPKTTPLEIEVTNQGANQSFDLGKKVHVMYAINGQIIN